MNGQDELFCKCGRSSKKYSGFILVEDVNDKHSSFVCIFCAGNVESGSSDAIVRFGTIYGNETESIEL